MPDRLEDELRALGGRLAVPEPREQWAAVRARLTQPAPRRHRVRILVVAVVAALAGTVAGIAPARAAVVGTVEGLLRRAGIQVRQEAAPRDLPASPLPSLRSTALDQAQRTALFPIRVPAALGTPEQVLTADPDPAGAPRVVTLVYRGGAVRLDQFDGEAWAFVKSAQGMPVATGWGVWVAKPHPVTYIGRDGAEHTETARLAGPTLIWVDREVTYRLEGLASQAEALQVARSL